ncbi:hypothetical protein F442_10826 [Phytophthora nicotianae P10297]|uniref:Uncharacterized protein n=1 Tax=Phytophthora nicotianae P10297 TaxID=1317064 RepID=W2Z4I3_PHYNI|nr:hypothetical protein F442_10826 [Phytophthora nicotianae P10297]
MNGTNTIFGLKTEEMYRILGTTRRPLPFLLDLVSDRRKKKRVHSHHVGASTSHGAERLHTSPPQASISITTIDSTTSEGNNQPPSTQSQPVLRVKKKRGSKTI